MQLDYTAPAPAPVPDTPERVRFAYRLAGYDDAWQDVGGRRQAFYTGLARGDYQFALAAAHGGSDWSAPATLTIRIPPAWYQTWWWRALCAVFLLSALVFLHRLRVSIVTRRVRAADRARMHERERIARDLHDNVLQTNFALLLQVRAVAATAADDAIGQRLDAIVSTAKATLSAGRDKVAGLRARRHAGATVLRITVTFGWRTCVIVISDNGRGIPPEYAGGRTGHWGLAGMRERAALMQARRGSTSTAGTQEPRSACSTGGGKRAIQHNWCQV